jgi:uridine kinase
MNMHLVLS